MTNSDGRASLQDCSKGKSQIVAEKAGFCSVTRDIDLIDLLNYEAFDLRPEIELTVRVVDENEAKLKGILVIIDQIDKKAMIKRTKNSGKAIFKNLCFGESAVLSVVGTSAATADCEFRQEEIIIGATQDLTIQTVC